MIRPRWSMVVGVALLAAAGDEAVAHSSRSDAARTRLRCERAIEREGHRYAELYSEQLGFCLRSLAECQGASGNVASYLCSKVSRMCEGIAASTSDEARLRQRLLEACDDVPLDRLLNDMKFGVQMADCAPTSLEAFIGCLRTRLVANQGELVGLLRPTACALLESAKLADDFPGVRCTPPGTGEECEECEPCEPTGGSGPAACGGAAGLTCGEGLACDRRDALCTNPQASGACVAVPSSCVDDGQPVCGCDGQTYASDCARLQAGVVMARTGACDPPPTTCSSSNDCGPGNFCEYVFADCGEGQPGTCQPMRAAPCDLCSAFVDGPVCGCDGQTYASECERQAAGASKLWFGPCF